MKYSLFIIYFLLFNCNSNKDITINNFNTNLSHSYNKFEIELLNKLNKDSLRGYKIQYNNINKHKMIISIIDTVKTNYDASYEIIIDKTEKAVSDLNCKRKIKINSKELTFVFCYYDVLNYLKLKKDIDTIYKHYEDIINTISKSEKINDNVIQDYLISDLIKNISFNIESSYLKTKIRKVKIRNFHTSFSSGTEHFIINNKNDTIAYFYSNRLMQ